MSHPAETDQLPLPPLNGLRAFEAAGRHLNFRRAADELGVTQGAVAQHVRKLEDRLGIKLFEREPRGVALTDVGRRYHAQVEAAFRLISDATCQLLPSGSRVTIMVSPTFASRWLLPAVPSFEQAHPAIDLRVLASESVPTLRAGEVDLQVRQGHGPFPPEVEPRLLFPEEAIAVCAPGLTEGDGSALMSRPLLHDPRELWPEFIEKVLGLPRPARLPGPRFSQTTLAIEAALAGQGVALVARALVTRELAAGRLARAHPSKLDTDKPFYALVPRDSSGHPSIKAVLGWLEEQGRPRGEQWQTIRAMVGEARTGS